MKRLILVMLLSGCKSDAPHIHFFGDVAQISQVPQDDLLTYISAGGEGCRLIEPMMVSKGDILVIPVPFNKQWCAEEKEFR